MVILLFKLDRKMELKCTETICHCHFHYSKLYFMHQKGMMRLYGRLFCKRDESLIEKLKN